MQNNTFSTLFVGQNLIKLSAVDSTNNFLKNLLSNSEPVPEGTVIMADHQFAGRGQQQNTWHAEPGKNLTFSVLLRPSFLLITNQFLLNIAVCVAVRSALAPFLGDQVKVKWPNDIYFGKRKLGGMLIENSLMGETIKTAVIGIGINVNQQEFEGNLDQKATSIFKILGQEIDLKEILAKICKQLEYFYLQLKSGEHTILRRAYVDSLYQINELCDYKQNDVNFKGTIKGVSDDGRLIVDRNGEIVHFNFKEIEFLTNV